MGTMPRDPFIREKFTRERTAARKHAKEYFQRFPKARYRTEIESWRELQSQKYLVHYEAVAGADRGWWRAGRWLIAAGSGYSTNQFRGIQRVPELRAIRN